VRSQPVLLGIPFLIACSSAGHSGTAKPSEPDIIPTSAYAAVAPPNTADSALVARLKLRRLAVDSLAVRDSQSILSFAHLPGDTIAPVHSAAEWPESTDVSYWVFKDAAGRAIVAYESPHSESGDWFLLTTHYFDSTGSTVIVERHASFFNGCWDEKGDSMMGIRETLTSYYDPKHRLAGREFVRTAFDTAIPAPTGNCNTMFQEPFPVYHTWQDLTKATGLAPFVQ
jgi:hypothetical protein